MMYMYSHGMLPEMIQDLYVTNNAAHHYAIRQSNLLHVPPGLVCIQIFFAIKVL